MDKTELLEIYTREQRIEVEYPDTLREVDGTVIRHISQTGEEGFVLFSRLNEDTVETAISAQIARFREVSQDFEWKAFDYDAPADLVDRLRRWGFEIGEPEALLVLDLSAGPEALHRPVPPTVVRLSDPGDVDAVVVLENAVWESDHHDLGERLKRDMQEHPEMVSVYVSYQDQKPVSAACGAGRRCPSTAAKATIPACSPPARKKRWSGVSRCLPSMPAR